MIFAHISRPTRTSYYWGSGRPVVSIGRFSYVDQHAHVMTYLSPPDLLIGDFCSIAANSRFFARQNHRPDWVSTFPFEFISGLEAREGSHDSLPSRIEVGHDIWIGDSATIFPGVTIGHGAVIGANAVVTKDVPPYSVFVGNPGRVVRMRFSEPVIEALLAIQWWTWDEARIREMAPLIWSADIDAFLAASGRDSV